MLKVGVITKKFKDGVNKMHVKCSIKHLFGIESQFWKHEMHCLRMVTLKMPTVLIRNLQMNKCSVSETVGGEVIPGFSYFGRRVSIAVTDKINTTRSIKVSKSFER